MIENLTSRINQETGLQASSYKLISYRFQRSSNEAMTYYCKVKAATKWEFSHLKLTKGADGIFEMAAVLPGQSRNL